MTMTASDSEIAQFRKLITQLAKARRNRRPQTARHHRLILQQLYGFVLKCRDAQRRCSSVATKYNVSCFRQLRYLLLDTLWDDITTDEFYLFQFYLPERRRERWRHFPVRSQCELAMYALLEHSETDAAAIRDKLTFAHRCLPLNFQRHRLWRNLIMAASAV